MLDIKNKQVAHIVAQIRAKQQATKQSQDKIQQTFIEYCEEHPDSSDTKLVKLLNQNLETYDYTSAAINTFIASQDLNNIGYPIKTNKTHLQLDMVKQWSANQGEELISTIKRGSFYHNLTNNITSDEIPILQSPSDQIYWGNENPSVSSVLLASISAVCDEAQNSMPGAATFFPFLNSSYALPDDLIPPTYPFTSSNGMMLLGDYQFGAHRYFKQQLLFGPEDCSTAVGKATYLTTEQIKTINTNSMKAAYSNPNNEYHYQPVTLLQHDIKDKQLKLIQPGDIYLIKGHTAIIATAPDNNSNIITLQFNRDIDASTNKTLGGGVYNYNLYNKVQEIKTGIYILRPSLEPLHETCSLGTLLEQIDCNYFARFPVEPTDMPGDCKIFLENNEITTVGNYEECNFCTLL